MLLKASKSLTLMASQIAFSFAIASASVIAGEGDGARLALRFVVATSFVGGAAHARARTSKDTSARVFFMMNSWIWFGCSAAVLCQTPQLVKDDGRAIAYSGVPSMVQRQPRTLASDPAATRKLATDGR